jgi:transcriptional regulator with XRE-family HTH domain
MSQRTQGIPRIKEKCEEKGMSLLELSRRSGIVYAGLNRLANGEDKNPTIRTLVRIAKVLDCDWKELWG